MLLLELLDQRFERAIEHLGEIARGHRVTEQGLGVAQAVVGLLTERHLEREVSRRERREPRVQRKRLNMPS